MINKKWTFALSVLSLSTALVCADQGAKMNQAPKMTPPQPMGVTSQPTGVITPPVAPVVNNGADFFIEADFIYWYAQESGLDYARRSEVFDGQPALYARVPAGTVAQANRNWEPGFKVGVGLELEHDGWDVFANWTWLNPVSGNSDSVYADPATNTYVFIQPFGDGIFANQLCQSATGSWSLHFNAVDLEHGRNFFLSRFMTLRPYFGLKSAWINQKFNRSYDLAGDTLVSPDGFEFGSVDTLSNEQSCESWGIGVRGGLSPVWHFSRCWGLYGNVALSAMYQYFSTVSEIETTYKGESFDITKVKRSNHTVMPVIELALGLQYTTWFYDEAYMLDVKAGWEEQMWIGANQFIDTAQAGNLTFEGFTFQVGFHF